MSRRAVFQLVLAGLLALALTSPSLAQFDSLSALPKHPETAPTPREKPVVSGRNENTARDLLRRYGWWEDSDLSLEPPKPPVGVHLATAIETSPRPLPHLSVKDQVVKVVAVVGASNIITEQEVMEEVRKHPAELCHLEGTFKANKEKELYQVEFQNLVKRELLINEMFAILKKNHKSIEEIEKIAFQVTDECMRSLMRQQGAETEEQFIGMLSAQGLTLPGLRRSFERQLLADEFVRGMFEDIGRTPTRSDMRMYYDHHPEEFKLDDQVRWEDLFISFDGYPKRAVAQAHARKVHELAAKGSDFVSLIKAEEKNPGDRQNWDGIGTTRQSVPFDVSPTVWSLKPGEISDVIETPTGLHIVKVLERQFAGMRPFDDDKVQNECRDRLQKIFREEDKEKLIDGIRRQTNVEVFDPPMEESSLPASLRSNLQKTGQVPAESGKPNSH